MSPRLVSGKGDKPNIDPEKARRRVEQAMANPPVVLCSFCGWRGRVPEKAMLGMPLLMARRLDTCEWDEFAVMEEGTMTCLRCRRHTAEFQDGPWIGFGVALRDADLTPEEFAKFSAYLENIGPSVTPERVAEDNPALAALVQQLAQWSPDRWLVLLGILVALVGVGHDFSSGGAAPAPEVRVVVEQAAPIVVDRTGQLTDSQMDQVLDRLRAADQALQKQGQGQELHDDKNGVEHARSTDTDTQHDAEPQGDDKR